MKNRRLEWVALVVLILLLVYVFYKTAEWFSGV